MKSKLFIVVLFLANMVNGQSYILDSSYGTQGYKFNDNFLLNPNGLLKLNQSYYYYSLNQISKTNYDGSLDLTFGVNGMKSLNNSSETFTINGGKIINNSIYLFGKIVNTNNSSEDGFVLKILDNGNYDNSFGVNGISKINLGENENIFDICNDNSGKLFCTAKKVNSAAKIITFKLLANGNIDTSFGTNSFKEYIFNPAQSISEVYKIIKFSDGYFLIGKNSQTSTYYLVIAKIDENGDYITSFATNGVKLLNLAGGSTISNIKDAQLVNSNLYVNILESSSFTSQYRYLRKININTFQTIFNIPIYYESNFKIDANENIYVVGANRCNTGPCIRDFMLKKFDASGNVDTNFAQNGSYTYSLPSLTSRDFQSSVVNLEEDDKIVIGGYAFRNYYDANNVVVGPYYGLTSIRIEQGILNNELFDLDREAEIYPNPVKDILKINILDEIKEISIYDFSSREILKNYDIKNKSINLENLSPGLYNILIKTDKRTYIKKVLKK